MEQLFHYSFIFFLAIVVGAASYSLGKIIVSIWRLGK